MIPLPIIKAILSETKKKCNHQLVSWSIFHISHLTHLHKAASISGILLAFHNLMYIVSKVKVTKRLESLRRKMTGFRIFPFRGCFDGCRDQTQTSGYGTRIWNLSDRPVELQIRVGSILKRVHTLKPGSSKRLKCKKIYKAYMPGKSGNSGGSMKSLLYYYDEACHPYIWVHDTGGDFTRMVKQQYISLEDLRDSSEIRIFRDHQRGCISVRKKPRPDFC